MFFIKKIKHKCCPKILVRIVSISNLFGSDTEDLKRTRIRTELRFSIHFQLSAFSVSVENNSEQGGYVSRQHRYIARAPLRDRQFATIRPTARNISMQKLDRLQDGGNLIPRLLQQCEKNPATPFLWINFVQVSLLCTVTSR